MTDFKHVEQQLIELVDTVQALLDVAEAAKTAKDCYWIGGPDDALKEFMAELEKALAKLQEQK